MDHLIVVQPLVIEFLHPLTPLTDVRQLRPRGGVFQPPFLLNATPKCPDSSKGESLPPFGVKLGGIGREVPPEMPPESGDHIQQVIGHESEGLNFGVGFHISGGNREVRDGVVCQ